MTHYCFVNATHFAQLIITSVNNYAHLTWHLSTPADMHKQIENFPHKKIIK